jgi:hypothetical protein
MQVRYQAAPRPDRGQDDSPIGLRELAECCSRLAAQNLDQLFEFQAHLMDELLALV